MPEMVWNVIIASIILLATVTIGFKALENAQKNSEESYGTQSLSALLTNAKMVTNGAVGSKQLVPVKLAGNSRIVFSNEMIDDAPQGRIDVIFSDGNKVVELVQLPINYVQSDRDIGNMTLINKVLTLSGSESTRFEVFFPQGEYRIILVHKRADETSWMPGKGTDFIEVSLY